MFDYIQHIDKDGGNLAKLEKFVRGLKDIAM